MRKAMQEVLRQLDDHIVKCQNRIVWLKGLADIEEHNKYRDQNDYIAHIELYKHLAGQLSDYLKGVNEYNIRLQQRLQGKKGFSYWRLKHRSNRVIDTTNDAVAILQAELLMERLQNDTTGASLKAHVVPAIYKLQKINKKLKKLRLYLHGF